VPSALATASRDELVSLATERGNQISKLQARVAELEGKPRRDPLADEAEDGRPSHDPSHERLLEWAKQCKIAVDQPNLEHFTPIKSIDDAGGRLQASELDGYNAAMSELAKQFQELVRGLYLDATGDTAGADSLSVDAMVQEIRAKSPPGEGQILAQKLSRERAGLQAPPADTSKTSPLERLLRAQMALGDQSEQALAKRVGAQRASAIRGDSWSNHMSAAGCPSE
jgi:hypothetical protein